MSCRIIPLNQRPINNTNCKNNIIPSGNKTIYDINENLLNYKNNFNIEQQPNIFNNLNINDKDINLIQNIISKSKGIIEQNANIKSKFNKDNFQRLIQDLQYSNDLLNKKNLALESELEIIKNKYNLTKNDIDDINKHISICKENQDKIINDLIDRINYLENTNSKNNLNIEDNKNNEIKNGEIANKNNIDLHLFIYKMKKIFCNNFELNEANKDEDNLNIIANNIIRINNELNIYKKELEVKNFEINKLKKENQILKIKLNQMNNNRQFLGVPNNNVSQYYTSSVGYPNFKTNIERKPSVDFSKDNISNYDFKDNYSNYSNSQIKIPKFSGKYKSHSPSPLRNNIINNVSKSPNAGIFKMHSFKTENLLNNNIPFDIKKYGIKEKKLSNSRSISQLKFNMLNDENDKNNNYQYPKATIHNKQCENSKNSLQNLMNNVAQLENALRDAQTNIDINSLDNNPLS